MKHNPYTATFVKTSEHSAEWAEGRIYKLDPPMADYFDNLTEYVLVSAATVPFSGPETFIFPCDADGEVDNWMEMDGSYIGGLNHEIALLNAGYTVD
jgi:hypothetical protein